MSKAVLQGIFYALTYFTAFSLMISVFSDSGQTFVVYLFIDLSISILLLLFVFLISLPLTHIQSRLFIIFKALLFFIAAEFAALVFIGHLPLFGIVQNLNESYQATDRALSLAGLISSGIFILIGFSKELLHD